MTAPARDDDDNWGDLYRDLGMDKPAPPAAKAVASPEPAATADAVEPEAEPIGGKRPPRGQQLAAVEAEPEPVEDDAGFAAEDDAGESDETADEGAAATDAPGDEGQPGTGRKRRRRRRRRKKGGPESADAAGEPAGVAARGEPAGEEAGDYAVTARVTEDGLAGTEEDAADADEEGGAAHLAAEEDTGSEVLRDLIANWNVPSWDDIVAGLSRPER
jgi:hypothetical protein